MWFIQAVQLKIVQCMLLTSSEREKQMGKRCRALCTGERRSHRLAFSLEPRHPSTPCQLCSLERSSQSHKQEAWGRKMRKLCTCMLSPAVRVVSTPFRPAWLFHVVANNFTIGPTVHSTSAWDGPGLSSYWRNKMDKTFYSLKKETNVLIIS